MFTYSISQLSQIQVFFEINAMRGNNLSHLVLSWWSKETAMMINFVLNFSSQTFLAHWLIDLHKRSHFELWFLFLLTSVGLESLEYERSHFLSSYHHYLLIRGISWKMQNEQFGDSMQSETQIKFHTRHTEVGHSFKESSSKNTTIQSKVSFKLDFTKLSK